MTDTLHIHSLDQLDMRLIAELETDANQTNKSLATKLGVHRTIIANRVQRLTDGNVIRTICRVAPLSLGYKFVVLFMIDVQHGWDRHVTDALAANRRISFVHLCTGQFGVLAWAQFRTGDDMLNFLTNDLKPITGIQHIEKIVTLEEVKVSSHLLTSNKEFRQPESPAKISLDDLDFRLIQELQTDATQNSGQLGQKLGEYQSTIFRRMRRLIDSHIISTRVYVNPWAVGFETIARIGMKSYPGKAREVANAIASYNQVQYVNLCVGRYDLTSLVVLRGINDLSDFINVELGKIPGLRDIETMIIYKTVKMSFEFEI